MKLIKSKRFWASLILFFCFFLVLIFVLWKILFSYLKVITEERLTKLFQTDVHIQHVEILDWKQWNELHLQVFHIKLKGTPTDSLTQVAYANKISAKLPIIDIFWQSDTLHIHDLLIDSLFLDFYVDNHRNKNYKLFKPYDPNRKKGPEWIEFHHSYIRACRFHYFFKLPQRDYLFELKNITPKLVIRRNDLDLQLDLEGYIPYLREKQTVFMQNASLQFHYVSNIKKAKHDNHFKECKMKVGGVPIEIGGRFYFGWERDYDLHIKVLNAYSDSLLKLFPLDIQKKIKVYDIDGNLNIQGKILGKWKPEFRVNFWTDSINITNTVTKVGLKKLFLKGNFFNGGEQGKPFAELNIDTLSGYIYNHLFFANLSIHDFNEFYVNGNLEISQNLAVVGKWIGFQDTSDAKGDIDAHINIQGKLRDIAAFDMEKVHLNGFLNAHDLNLPSDWTPFEIQQTNFQLLFNNHEILLKNAKAIVNHQPIEIQGWLSTKAFGLKPQIIANANITFDTLSLQNFIRKTIQKNTNFFPRLPDNFYVNINVKANQILYKKIELQKSTAKLSLIPRKLLIHEIVIQGKQDSLLLQADFQQIHSDTIQFNVYQNIHTQSFLDILKELGFSLEKKEEIQIALANQSEIHGKIFYDAQKKVDGIINLKLCINQLKYPRPEIELTNFHARLNTTLNKILHPKNSSWLIEHAQGEINHQPFEGSIGLIPSPQGFWVYPSFHMELCLDALQPFIKPDNISDYSGNFEYSYFGQGLLKNYLKPDSFVYQSAHGEISIHNLAFLIENKNLPFENINGEIIYDDYGLTVHQICGKMGNSDFCVNGQTKNILAYLFLKDTRLNGRMNFRSDSLFIKELTAQNFSKSKEEKIKTFDIKLPQNVNVDIEGQIMHAIIDKLQLDFVLLNACVQDRIAFVDDFDAYFDKGYWKSHVLWDGRDTNHQYIAANLILKNLNVKNFLYDFDNFQQSFIEHQNIEGDLSLEAYLEMYFPSNLKTDFSSLKGKFSFTLENGVLRNFIPFQKLRGVVRKKYLEAPKFTMMANDITIQNRTLFIPKLEIRSDIGNIVISGTHTFDQDISYSIQILRVKRRFKENKTQAIRYNKTALLFRLVGSRGKYKLTYDFKAFWNRFIKKQKL